MRSRDAGERGATVVDVVDGAADVDGAVDAVAEVLVVDVVAAVVLVVATEAASLPPPPHAPRTKSNGIALRTRVLMAPSSAARATFPLRRGNELATGLLAMGASQESLQAVCRGRSTSSIARTNA